MESSEERWQEIVQYHVEFYPFSVRVLTTYPVLWIHQMTGLPLRETFFVFQYLLMAAVGLALYRFLLLLGYAERSGQVGLVLFLGSFPVLFAHSEPIFTWDDPWVYLALVLSFTALIRRNALTASLWFTLGLFAREQTVLYFPVFLLGLWLLQERPLQWHVIGAAILPPALFLPFWFFVWQEPDPMRYQLLAYNFSDWPHTINSLFSLFISFGFLWVAWIAGLSRGVDMPVSRAAVDRFVRIGSIVMVVPTILVGLAFAYARETRIFFSPFVLMIPLALGVLRKQMTHMIQSSRRPRYAIVALIVCLIIGGVAGTALFRGFDYRNCPDFCRLWGSIHLGLSLVVLWWLWRGRRSTAAAQHSERDSG